MIKDVVIVGLGGVGAVYASKIPNVKVLVDEKRLEFYRQNPTVINGDVYNFNYVTSLSSSPDLIIIAVKFYNLDDVLGKLVAGKNTKIISLINGISSEQIISDSLSAAEVIPSFLICNSIIRNGREVTHDGVNKIVMGKSSELEGFFDLCGINYEAVENIKDLMWGKFMLNIIANQLSAVTGMTFGEMNSLPYIDTLLRKILKEVIEIASAEGVKHPESLAEETIHIFRTMAPYGKTSMLQDIENNRKCEIDAFAGTIIKLGQKHNIPTPYNNLFNYLLNIS